MHVHHLRKNIDLKDAYQEWNRRTPTSWTDTKKHFSKEIKMNKTNPAIMKRKELANAVMAQTKEDESKQRQALEIVVLQTKKIQELEAKIKQQLANIATNSVPGRIPASIDTSSSSSGGGGSTTSTVTKEEMMQMFSQFTKNSSKDNVL